MDIIITMAPVQPMRERVSWISSTERMQPEAGSREKMMPTLLEGTCFSQWICSMKAPALEKRPMIMMAVI